MKSVWRVLVLCVVISVMQMGCSTFSFLGDIGEFSRSSGPIQLQSAVEESHVIRGSFEHRFYTYESKDRVDFYLVDGDLANPKQAIHIRMFWEPRVGLTQVDSSAINAEIDYIVFAGEEVGIYGGGGLFFPTRWNSPKDGKFSGTMEGMTVTFVEGTKNFKDLLGVAIATGSVDAVYDEKKAIELRTQLNVLIDQRLGEPRFVKRFEDLKLAAEK